MANNVFDGARFGILLRKHMKENLRRYLLFIALLTGIQFVLQGFLTVLGFRGGGFPQGPMQAIFILTLLFCGPIFSSLFYSFFQNKAKGIHFLQMPSSLLEKIVISFLVTQVLFFIVFMASFYSVNWVMCTVYNSVAHVPASTTSETTSLYTAQVYDFTDSNGITTIVFFFILSAIAHFGSLLFEKNAFVKIGICVMVIGGSLLWFNFVSLDAMIPEVIMPEGVFYNSGVIIGQYDAVKGIIRLPEDTVTFINYFLPLSLYILFWMASFFKMKEKQV